MKFHMCKSQFHVIPKDPIDNKSALIQVRAWCQTGDKLWPAVMITQFRATNTAHLKVLH